jgi:radical SAM superfamily enzyme YgiQ (UPF0313 family)
MIEGDLADEPRPDAVLVTSMMTYWYPGVFEVIRLVKTQWPGVPVALGGVYAGLCREHAVRHSGADLIARPGGLASQAGELAGWLGLDPAPLDWPPEQPPMPACHLLGGRSAMLVATSLGCPFRCTYCASGRLQPRFVRFPPERVLAELVEHAAEGARDVAFSDDALLVDAAEHLEPILQGVIDCRLPLRFHTPNGLHPRYFTPGLARLMKRAGFETIRLSFESVDADRQRASSGKVSTTELAGAVEHLRAAGFPPGRIGVYALAGLPGQPEQEAEETVRTIRRIGAESYLAWFSPIPGTPEFDRWIARTGADSGEPLLQNNTARPWLFPSEIDGDACARLAALRLRLNRDLPPA